MSEPTSEQAVPAAILAKADQALLLARIAASAMAIACFTAGEFALSSLSGFQAMFTELGAAELPVISRLLVGFRSPLLLALPVLFLVTLGFIWARGKAAAWMAGLGLLLMILLAPLAVLATLLPLVRIISQMGNM
ncbi:hypothetical protein [Haloferula sp. BvORR071]|uniref:hypothetical protein n=1 Tax=Haloferula sp. BvORR071 TaxID=1396141 RepID=UPI0005539584|nr:hypothetical protein [Haloferula sp. BvORR071]